MTKTVETGPVDAGTKLVERTLDADDGTTDGEAVGVAEALELSQTATVPESRDAALL